MKTLLLALLAGALLGCANDGPTSQELGDQLGRGVRGEGQLGTIDRSNDPYVKAREGEAMKPEAQ